MDHPEIILVLARANNGVIGNDGAMPWHIPADMRHFKQVTKNRPMIMGRKTFESLPGTLPGRRHIVLTRDTEWAEEDAEVVHSPEEALKLANSGPNAGHICIIGGAEIYELFLPKADRIELTEVKSRPKGDTKIAAFSKKGWEEIAREEHSKAGDIPAHAFVTLRRKTAS